MNPTQQKKQVGVGRQLLIAAVLVAPLYVRQRDVERRQRLWRQAFLSELNRYLDADQKAMQRFTDSVQRYVKEVNRELEKTARRS